MSSVGWMVPAAFYKELHVTVGGTVPISHSRTWDGGHRLGIQLGIFRCVPQTA